MYKVDFLELINTAQQTNIFKNNFMSEKWKNSETSKYKTEMEVCIKIELKLINKYHNYQ